MRVLLHREGFHFIYRILINAEIMYSEMSWGKRLSLHFKGMWWKIFGYKYFQIVLARISGKESQWESKKWKGWEFNEVKNRTLPLKRGSFESKHNCLMLLFYSSWQTCFGLCTGHLQVTRYRIEETIQCESQNRIHEPKIQRISLSFNFPVVYISSLKSGNITWKHDSILHGGLK